MQLTRTPRCAAVCRCQHQQQAMLLHRQRSRHAAASAQQRHRQRSGPRRTAAVNDATRRSFLGAVAVVLGFSGAPLMAPAAELGGDCPTCLGPLDGTLGSCSGISDCSSSYDDRPPHFVAPWQFDGTQQAALQQLVDALRALGADVQQQQADYVYATLPQQQGGASLDLEFLFAANDNTVALRAAVAQPDGGGSRPTGLQAAFARLLQSKPEQVLEDLRLLLRWEEVPILRFRQRTLFFGESPFDSFGPVAPPVPDYERDLEFLTDERAAAAGLR